MLLAVVPPALVDSLVGPIVDSKTIFLVISELTIIAHTIFVDVDPVAIHIVVFPLAVVFAAILH